MPRFSPCRCAVTYRRTLALRVATFRRPRPDHSLEERNSLRLGLRIIGRRQPPGAAFGRVLDNTRHFIAGLCGLRRAPTGLGGERGAVVCSGASWGTRREEGCCVTRGANSPEAKCEATRPEGAVGICRRRRSRAWAVPAFLVGPTRAPARGFRITIRLQTSRVS